MANCALLFKRILFKIFNILLKKLKKCNVYIITLNNFTACLLLGKKNIMNQIVSFAEKKLLYFNFSFSISFEIVNSLRNCFLYFINGKKMFGSCYPYSIDL